MLDLQLLLFIWLALSATAFTSSPANTCTFADVTQNATLAQTCKILCRPAKWTNVVTFLVGDYLAHVATIRELPGQGVVDGVIVAFWTLLFPATGLAPALKAVTSMAVFQKSPLRAAARAKALYMVVKSEDIMTDKQQIEVIKQENAKIEQKIETIEQKIETAKQDIEIIASKVEDANKNASAADLPPDRVIASRSVGLGDMPRISEEEQPDKPNEEPLNPLQRGPLTFGGSKRSSKTIHGLLSLPAGWRLDLVPSNATFADNRNDLKHFSAWSAWFFGRKRCSFVTVGHEYKVSKAVIALAQTLYAISTLYSTSIYQIHQFGFVAPGLTVIPFAFMSLVNLFANLICPTYPAIFIVENDALDSLRQRIKQEEKSYTFYVEGTVGRFTGRDNPKAKKGQRQAFIREQNAIRGTGILLLGVMLGLIGGLSKFKNADSNLSQRVWIMLWLTLGWYIGGVMGYIHFQTEYTVFGEISHGMEHDLSAWSTVPGSLQVAPLLCAIPIGAYVKVI